MEIRQAEAGDIAVARKLMKEYQEELGEDLCFQGFAAELAGLPGHYAPPAGALLLVWEGSEAVGCGAFRPCADAGACEMKRLYLRPAYRGGGRGAQLALALMSLAARTGYRRIRLDTLPSMQAARGLYQRLGFVEIGAYYPNPLPGVTYLEAELGR